LDMHIKMDFIEVIFHVTVPNSEMV
jgi:hypothetical protein